MPARDAPCPRPRGLRGYDRGEGTGGPTELCQGEPPVAARDYGRSHGAEWNVVSDPFEFYVATVPADTAQLDPQMLIEVHRGLERDTFASLQGG